MNTCQNIISKTKNGLLTFCHRSKLFQLLFNNLCFEFYEWELENFKSHILKLDILYWEKLFKHSINLRKIPISLGEKYFVILLNKQEVNELKKLLNYNNYTNKLLKYNDIEYTHTVN